MEFALALLSLSPAELEALGWTFADRKRLLDHFVRSGKAVQGKPLDEIDEATVTLRLPQRDVMRLQIFRSEEHTSELQSLMRISYAVLCLKKKKTNNTHNIHQIKEYSTK